ncbi:MAG: sugar phosphate isomerase/epimerase family protein [Planctomycetota bacterium]|jgi:sugar phosphate isomerase/epimerase
MARPITLFTGQWADLPLVDLARKSAQMGYDGLELACWGDHFDVTEALDNGDYCRDKRALLARHDLDCFAISNHLAGQAVCDRIDHRHQRILPSHVWGDGEPEGVRRRAAREIEQTARAAERLGVGVVNGFTGSLIWPDWYFFPPTSEEDVQAGFDDFALRWRPILDVFAGCGVKFALEVHPGEIAYDLYTAERACEAIGGHEAFGFNFDPSHLLWQGVDPVQFINRFRDRIHHVHMKDVAVRYDGRAGILGSHLAFGDHRRAWEFRSVGRGDVEFDEIIRALNRIGYDGPLSVEWEDTAMDREHGAAESSRVVREIDFNPSATAFDEAFRKEA